MATSVLERHAPFEGATSVEPTSLSDPASPAKVGKAEAWLAFVAPFIGYVVLGCLLTLRWHVYFGDAVSREANAFYVFFSNNPHLAAIGFVWNPLTSIVEMPLILLHGFFPALTREALAASIMSAVFMAGTCYQVLRFFDDLALSRAARWALVICFALNPMIVVYGASGMSEALFSFTLAITARYLARWLRDGTTRALVTSAAWLGIAYAARNEVVAGAAAATVLVAVVTLRRTEGTQRDRRLAAATDSVIFCLPFAASFLLWAGVSWLIVGHPFEQLSSVYGTSSQLKALGYTSASYNSFYGSTGFGHFRYTGIAMWTFAPLFPAIFALAAYRSWKYRNPAILAVLAIVGGVCGFELAAFTFGQISWGYRYDIYMVLLSVMVAGCAVSASGVRSPRRSPGVLLTAGRRAWALRVPVAILAVAMLLPGFITTGRTEFYSTINRADWKNYVWVLWPNSKRAKEDEFRTQWAAIRDFDRQLAALHLPNGSLMVDNFTSCIPMLILMSPHPSQFAIPNDEDYKQRLGAPYQDGIRYMLVSDPSGVYGRLDSLNVAFPTLYQDGGGLGSLAIQVQLPVCGKFRLYKLYPLRA